MFFFPTWPCKINLYAYFIIIIIIISCTVVTNLLVLLLFATIRDLRDFYKDRFQTLW